MQNRSDPSASGAPAALRYDLGFADLCSENECAEAIAIVEGLRRDVPGQWINFPLMNKSGATDDFTLEHSGESGTYTAHAARFPRCKEIVERFRAHSLVVTDARIAVLLERGIFRPHRDSYDSSRFLIPINQHDTDFRHIVDPQCFLMRAGELWWIDGKSLHAAANVGDRAKRIMLLVDVTSASRREALGPSRPIPADHRCVREPWTDERRAALFAELRAVVDLWDYDDLERELLMIPFLYELDVPRAYDEIASFCDLAAVESNREEVRRHYALLADCLRNPPLPFQVAASGFSALE